MPEVSGRLESRLYRKHEAFTLAILTGLAALMFLFVTGLSHLYRSQEQAFANQWSSRGVAQLEARNFKPAVDDFRTALLYSTGNYSYQLSLAQALLGEGRADEAKTYLMTLWARQPEDGLVNLELARIASRQGETEKALRYYHNAIYATWPSDEESERRDTRLELVNYLLSINAKAQAQSELIALAANLGEDSAMHARVGDLFAQTGDYRQALAEYRLSLRHGRQSEEALAGAGRAAFELADYPQAEKYLQQALADAPGDSAIASQLKTAELAVNLDPFRQQIRVSERDQIVVKAFAAAGERLQTCQSHTGDAAAQSTLAAQWDKMKPEVTEQGLRRNPDLVNSAMELVFGIERQAGSSCPASSDTDTALLLIGKLHEGI